MRSILVNGEQVSLTDSAATELGLAADEAPEFKPTAKAYSWLDFVELFTPTEQAQLTAAAVADPSGVGLWYWKAVGTQGLVLSDPRTIEGVDALLQAGLITSDRRNKILAGEKPDGP